MILVLWVINLLVGLIQRTFSTGKVLGRFYRAYIHPSLKILVVKFVSIVFRRTAITNERSADSIKV